MERLQRHNSISDKGTEHTRIWREILKKIPEYAKTMRILSNQEWDLGILPPEYGITFYTDGSIKNGYAGAGLYCDQLKVKEFIRLEKHW